MSGAYIYVCEGADDRATRNNRFFTINPVVVNSVKDMADKVLERVGGNLIKNLYICGHGSPGYQSVGAGVNTDPSGQKCIATDYQTGYLRGGTSTYLELLRLRGKFTPDAIITLGGCQVGAGELGELFLIHVSRIWERPVQAGIENQSWIYPGMEGPVTRCDGSTGACISLPRTFWGSPGGDGIN